MNNNEKSGALTFFAGVLLMGAGVFLFCNMVTVSTVWYNWGFLSFGRYNFTNGLVSVPLIIGLIMLFFNPKSAVPKVIIALGAIFLILTVIMSIQFRFEKTSLFNYILTIGMMAAGAGLVLRILFGRSKNKK